jgi:hypothetical protein
MSFPFPLQFDFMHTTALEGQATSPGGFRYAGFKTTAKVRSGMALGMGGRVQRCLDGMPVARHVTSHNASVQLIKSHMDVHDSSTAHEH